MASELIAGLGLFKTGFDIAKGLKDINDATVRNAAVIELQEKILAAREQQLALLQHVGELEKAVARFKNWETEKQRYQLTDIGLGVKAYTLKPGMENGELPHEICANCYHDSHKSLLQPETRFPGRTCHLICHSCGSDVIVSGGRDSVSSKLPTHTNNGRRRQP